MAFPLTTRRWNPWGELLALQDEVNRLFESTYGPPSRAALLGTDFNPPVDVIRDKNNIVVKMDAPGMKKEDLDISVMNQSLVIRGQKKHEAEKQSENVYRSERFFGTFERVIDLPNPVDTDSIKATFTDGVLEIVCPVKPEARPRQIAVDVK